jgi:hypothetical protein|tara:strand:+ start:1035 stop:1946 length:912 start_codon:yes stop_codon:yes gene_type:complete
MEHSSEFSVRYLTENPVPIREIIESLQSVETILNETARLLPNVIDGLQVERINIRVREVAQESPLRELFIFSLFLAFQKQLEQEVPDAITEFTGFVVPDRFDTIVTVLALVIVFYGAGAIKDLVFGKGPAGAAENQLNGLLDELSLATGKPVKVLRGVLEARYKDKTLWTRLANTTSGFFAPSKNQESSPVEVNQRRFDENIIRDIPAEFVVEHESQKHPSRPFTDTLLEIHAQDKDRTASGWYAVIPEVSDKRLKLKLMDGVSAAEIWQRDNVRGDVTVLYDRLGVELVPREVHLERVIGFS